jgi:oxygen-dependent protoporphyrinogen oxidase
MAAEWFRPPRKAEHDETVAELVERHYGTEMVDRLADPLLSGVYGGEASQLSVRAVLPRFAEMEANYGSLGRAMLKARKKMGTAMVRPAAPLFTSLREGMQQMVDAVVTRIDPKCLCTSAPVQAVNPQNGGWTVSAGYSSDHFDGLIIATPAPAAAALIEMADEQLSNELRAIRYSSSVTVTLGYGEEVRRSLPPGFGFLVPRSEGFRMLAATFVHNKFPHRAPNDRAIIRCFLGGARDEEILDASENAILYLVRNELSRIIHLAAEPLFARVYKWKGAMAQYGAGHLERLERIEKRVQTLPQLALAGNGFRGIGVPDCVRSGTDAAAKVLSSMGLQSEAVASTKA